MKKERETLTEKAYRIIKNDILYGKFKQNEVISINALSDELGISRTPITNAFQKLELEDFVTVLPKQGVFVKPITITETREIYELRAAIETFSAKRAFDMINEENIEWLKESVKKQKKFLEDENYQSFMVED
ncbi:GntR family transcriptional regulator [Megasphaera sp.]|nr:GntR family transcriptional regulator [Megasphaera sp.]